MVSSNTVERILRLLQTVRDSVVGVESGITLVDKRKNLDKVGLERACTGPSRRGQRFHADRTSDCHVPGAEGKAREYDSDEGRLMRVVFGEDHLILELDFFLAFAHTFCKCLKVCLQRFTDLILVQLEADPPHVHVVLVELRLDDVLKLTRAHQPDVVLIDALTCQGRALPCEFLGHVFELLIQQLFISPLNSVNGLQLNLLLLIYLPLLALLELSISRVDSQLAVGSKLGIDSFQLFSIMTIESYVGRNQSYRRILQVL